MVDMIDFQQQWSAGESFEDFLRGSVEHKGLWEGVYRLARVPDWAIDADLEGATRRFLVIAEDWCGDAANTVPVLAKWTREVPGLELRLIRRDEHPEVMNRYLTGGSRSIPIVIALDDEFREVGHWGPRPAELQEWVVGHRHIPGRERYPQVRRWYARDRGVSTLCEVAAAAGLAVVAEPCS